MKSLVLHLTHLQSKKGETRSNTAGETKTMRSVAIKFLKKQKWQQAFLGNF